MVNEIMEKTLLIVICLIAVNSGVWSQAPDLARTPEAKKLVDEYIKAGGKNVQDVKNLLEEPFSEPFTPMEILVGKNDSLAGPLLIYVLKNYADSGVKKDCIDALVKLKDKRAEPALRELLDYKDWGVRLSAVIALLKFSKTDNQAIVGLRNILLFSPDAWVRGSSTKVVSDFDPLWRQYLLKAAVEDKDWKARFRAIDSFLILGYRSVESTVAIRPDPAIRDIALVLLVNWLKTAPVTEWQYAGDAIRLLQDFADYFAGSEWVIRELQQIPKDFKTGSYDLLMEKIKAKSSGQ